jgi:hypothetical protein
MANQQTNTLLTILIVVLLLLGFMLFANSMRGDGDVVNEVPQNGQQQDWDSEGGVNDEDNGSEGEDDEADGDQAGEEIAGQGIVVTSPTSGRSVSSPLMITGRAQGGWYFEATFPVQLFSSTGALIASGYATAQGDWMTEEYVPFSASLSFAAPENVTSGKLVITNANPSGLPEHERRIEVPVTFVAE